MKKIIVVFLVCMFSVNCHAQIYPKVAISWSCSDKIRIEAPLPYGMTNRITWKLPPVTVNTGLEYRYKRFDIWYNNTFWCRPVVSKVSFDPEEVHFAIGSSFLIAEKMKISVEHTCWHSIFSSGENHNAIYGGNVTISLSYGY